MTRRGAYSPGSIGMRVATLGQRIRAIRKAWGWTQRELATLLHVGQNAVSQWETDQSKPIGPVQARILSLFQVSEEALVHGKKFTIPDLAHTDTKASGPLVVGWESSPVPKQLPPGRPGKAWRLPLAEGSPRLLSLEDALAHVERILGEGGSICILDHPGAKK